VGDCFLPFRDSTSGHETYGGGRYLFDTIKNTDGLALELAAGAPAMTIDFNYRLQPLLRLRRPVGMSTGAAGELVAGADPRRGEGVPGAWLKRF